MSDGIHFVEPTPPQVEYYDPIGTPVQFELVVFGATVFSVSEINGGPSYWQVSLGPSSPVGITFPTYVPPGLLGGNTADGLYTLQPVGAAIISIDSVDATENTDGTGAHFDLTANTDLVTNTGPILPVDYPTAGVVFLGAVAFQILYDIPDPPVAFVQSVRMTGYRLYKLVPLTPNTNPPVDPGGNSLDALNPGFHAEVERSVDFWDDLVEVFLFDRVNLTVESEGARLGFHNRGHIINRVELEVKASLDNGVKIETIDWTYTLEKIPGTLLPGAGTSTPAQDAAGTGAEVPSAVGLDTAGTGIELGGLA